MHRVTVSVAVAVALWGCGQVEAEPLEISRAEVDATAIGVDTIAIPHVSPGFVGSAAERAAEVPVGTGTDSGFYAPIGGLATGRAIIAVRARVADEGPNDRMVVLLTAYDPGIVGPSPAPDGQPPRGSVLDVPGTRSNPSAGSGVTETVSAAGFSVRMVPGVLYNVCVRKWNGTSATTRVLHLEIDVR